MFTGKPKKEEVVEEEHKVDSDDEDGVMLVDVERERLVAASRRYAADSSAVDLLLGEIDDQLAVNTAMTAKKKAARVLAAQTAQTVPATSAFTCHLRVFLNALALKLGFPNSDTLVDWTSPEVLSLGEDSSDADVMRVMRSGGYAVSRTLFWMQNRACFSHVHIMHDIITSREWTARFFEALRLVVPPIKEKRSDEDAKEAKEDKRVAQPALARMPRAKWELMAQHNQLTELRERFAQPLALGPDDRLEPVAFALPGPPPLSGKSASQKHVTLELAMFRDASRNQNLTHEHREAAIARFLSRDLFITDPEKAKATAAKLASRHHAVLTLTRLIAMDFAPEPATSVAYNYQLKDRAAIVDWLRSFIEVGCACTS